MDSVRTRGDRSPGDLQHLETVAHPRAVIGFGLLGAVGAVVGGSIAGAAGARDGQSGWMWSVPDAEVGGDRVLLGIVVYYAGLVLLVRSWLLLRAHVESAGRSPGWVVMVAALWALPFLVSPPLSSRDVYAYGAQGAVVEAGLDPYVDGPGALEASPLLDPVDPEWRTSPSPYGPLFSSAAGQVARIAGDPVRSVFGFRLLALAGLGLVAWRLPGLARSAGVEPSGVLVLALANPFTLLHLVSGAHNEALMVGVMVLGLALGRDPRHRWMGVVLCGCAAAIKAPALLACAYLGWTWAGPGAGPRHRVAGAAAASLSGVLVLGSWGLLTGFGWGWVDSLLAERAVTDYLSISTVAGVVWSAVAGMAGSELSVAEAVDATRTIGFLVSVAAVGWWMLRSHLVGSEALALMLVAVAVFGPGTQAWHLAWGGVVWCAVAAGRQVRRLAVVSIVLTIFVPPVGPRLGTALYESASLWTLGAWLVFGLTVATLTWRRPLLAIGGSNGRTTP